jgi:protein phosphatase
VIVEALFGDRDLVAVADGMGGHAGGEIASEQALQTLLSVLESSNDLAEGVRRANEALIAAAKEHPEWKGMGTTLVALLRVGDEYLVANVGDSRAYRLDPTGIQQITEDHSFTAEAVSSGRLSEDEAERSPWRNALTRAVGTDEDVEVDVFGPYPVEPAHKVVLCSDGLYRVMPDDDLAEEILAQGTRPDTARNLVADALRRGSSDNISVALVEFGVMEEARQDTATAPPADALLATEPSAAVGIQDLSPEASTLEGALAPEPPLSAPLGAEGEGGDVEDARVVAAPETSGSTVAPSDAATAGKAQDAASTGEESGANPSEETEVAEAAPAFRTARTARVSRSARSGRSRPLTRRRSRRPGLPPWVRREFVPAMLLVAVTLAIVFVLVSFLD